MTALEADIAEELMKVRLAVRLAASLEMSRAQERLLALGADEVLKHCC